MPKLPQNYIEVLKEEYGNFANLTRALLEITNPALPRNKRLYLVDFNNRGHHEITNALDGTMLLETDSEEEADEFLLHFEF